MNRRNPILLPLILSVILAGFITGCATTPKMAAYKTLATIGYSVDGAMMAYGKAVAQGQVRTDTRAMITVLHDNKYNPAYTAAVQAAKFDYSTAAPSNVVELASEIITAIDAIVHPIKAP